MSREWTPDAAQKLLDAPIAGWRLSSRRTSFGRERGRDRHARVLTYRRRGGSITVVATKLSRPHDWLPEVVEIEWRAAGAVLGWVAQAGLSRSDVDRVVAAMIIVDRACFGDRS